MKAKREWTMYKMMIVNDQGSVITHPEGDIFQGNDHPKRSCKSVLENNEKRGSFLTTINNKTYMTSYVKADELGWNFIILSDYGKCCARLMVLNIFILRITLLCLAIIAITSAFFTKIIYVPIYHLIKRALPAAESNDKPLLNEYDLLNKSFSLLENKINTLQSDINQSASARKQSLLRSLLHGTIGKGSDVQLAIKKLDLGQESDQYVVCVLKIDSFHGMSDKYDIVDISLLKSPSRI